MKQHKVFLIDDHPLIREGIAKIVEQEEDLTICGSLGGVTGALDRVIESGCDVLLLDLSLGDGSGLELLKDLRSMGETCSIIVISMHDETLYAERALRAGANGYLMKEAASDFVIEGIRQVLSGEIYLSEPMMRSMINNLTGKPGDGKVVSLHLLTDRELEIFELLGHGVVPSEIATKLRLSPKTVDSHRANIRDKLGYTSSTALMCAAVRWVESRSFIAETESAS